MGLKASRREMSTKPPAQAGLVVGRSLDAMSSNIAYVTSELAELEIDDGIRFGLIEFCDNFAGVLRSLRAEIPLLRASLAGDEADARTRSQAIEETLWGWMMKLHAQVTTVDEIVRQRPGHVYMGLGVLLRESAANILNAYVELRGSLRFLAADQRVVPPLT